MAVDHNTNLIENINSIPRGTSESTTNTLNNKENLIQSQKTIKFPPKKTFHRRHLKNLVANDQCEMQVRNYYQIAGWVPYKGGRVFQNFGPEFQTKKEAKNYYEELKAQAKLPENVGIANCTWFDGDEERGPMVEYHGIVGE